MLPKVNQILHLQVASIDDVESKKEYKSRVADVSGDNIALEIPLDEKTGKLKRLYIGDELSIYFVSEGGVKNYFNSYVVGFEEDVFKLVLIKKPDVSAITKVQRRNFFRVSAILEAAMKVTEQVQFLAVTDDVGGGGVSFICDGHWPLKEKDIATCWLVLPFRNGTIEHANFKSELVRVKPLETGKQLAMTRFQEIMDVERQKIIRYCFERQMDFRKK